ncbi:DeoR family transcriptional regulator [Orenia metallireducens]|uniref:Transcriptional regulator, DeoR family n=1 Tax=Orenia metallireducens TaxID=1413210 RepID=A0A285G0R1_9FIRM|nr:DeoR/GlpR family DNA-binding transcription regulator [Orenia metallireducens]PRX31690.1 DeoR family transcriptional regulator [Orenia metallireducens]SNY16923.1 transcriptional regulator, DeoR family [Orenia metallireducens]
MIKIFAEERQLKIVEILEKNNSVTVNQLCEQFNVSASTIRRDLQLLEEQSLIQRTHGGAVAKGGTKFEPSFIEKEKEHHQAKVNIGRKAAGLINEGDTIILDAGTTTTELAKHLGDYQDLTVVTNGVNIALELSQGNCEVILIGGHLRKHTLAMVGPVAEDNLSKFYADKVFLGTNGIDLKAGITTPDLVEANTKKTMLERAKEVIVLADYSKFEETSFVKVVEIEEVDIIVSDSSLKEELVDSFKEKVDIILA